jgi:hypothetical protein
MQKLPLFLIVIGLLFGYSCKKSNSSHTPTDVNGWVSSISLYSPEFEERIIDSFIYDSSHRISTYRQLSYDSIYGYPQFATWSAIFSLPAGGKKPPDSYKSDRTGTQELHQLIYKAQGRITRDSSLGNSGWVIYFGYPSGKIAINAFFNGKVSNSTLDTLTLSNGNITGELIYQPNNAHTADSLQVILGQGYSGLANPSYHSSLTNSIGPLIYILATSGYGNNFDAISQKAFNSQSATYGPFPAVSVSYTQYTDNQGRLTQEITGSDVLSFRYN